jgi:hypothetical protein
MYNFTRISHALLTSLSPFQGGAPRNLKVTDIGTKDNVYSSEVTSLNEVYRKLLLHSLELFWLAYSDRCKLGSYGNNVNPKGISAICNCASTFLSDIFVVIQISDLK